MSALIACDPNPTTMKARLDAQAAIERAAGNNLLGSPRIYGNGRDVLITATPGTASTAYTDSLEYFCVPKGSYSPSTINLAGFLVALGSRQILSWTDTGLDYAIVFVGSAPMADSNEFVPFATDLAGRTQTETITAGNTAAIVSIPLPATIGTVKAFDIYVNAVYNQAGTVTESFTLTLANTLPAYDKLSAFKAVDGGNFTTTLPILDTDVYYVPGSSDDTWTFNLDVPLTFDVVITLQAVGYWRVM